MTLITMQVYKENIRQRTDFVALVEEKLGPLKRRPTDHSPVFVTCPWHDDHTPSLAIYPDHATCFGACNQTWDAFGWAMKVWRTDFATARDELARRAGIPRPTTFPDKPSDPQGTLPYDDGLRIVADFFIECLWSTPAALDHAHQRGWSDETIRSEQIGYASGNRQALADWLQAAGLRLTHRAAKVALHISIVASKAGGMFVYVHRYGKRVVYLSARSLESKQHYNPPANLAGPRQPYLNALYASQDYTIVVEGQADAISLTQWGQAGLALAGCTADDQIIARLRRHPTVYLALDSNPAGIAGAQELAMQLGPLTRILTWPADGDANDALRAGMTAEQVEQMLREAPEWVHILAQKAAQGSSSARDEALRTCFEQIAQLDSFALATRRASLAQTLCLGLREFDRLLADVIKARSDSSAPVPDLRKTISSPGGYIPQPGVLFEMIVTQEQPARALFAVRWPNGQISLEPHLDLEAGRLVPLNPSMDLIQKGVVLFPSAIGEYGDEASLYTSVQSFIHRYLDIDEFYEKVAGYYVLLSWLYDSFSVLPYLRALGDYGTGKTRFLQVIGNLCYRPMFAGGASTTSPLFRIIDMLHGTLILDEADFAASDAEVDIVKILNCGYLRGFPVLRTVKDGEDFDIAALDVFGPKILATRKRYKDRALESRMLTHEMRGSRLRPDIPIILPCQFHTEALELRNKLLRYRLNRWQPNIEVELSNLDRAIEPRLNQVTLALLTIIEDEGLRQDIRNFIREYHRQLLVDRSMSLEALILETLLRLHEEAQQRDPSAAQLISLKDLAKRATETLITDTGQEQETPPLTSKKVGYIVREGLRLSTAKRNGVYHVVWDEERIIALKARYGLEAETEA